jgi:hypothetical protein
MKKKILIGLAVGAFAVIVIGVIIVGFFLGSIVKAGMETVGPKVTQSSLTVGSVHIGILTGSAGVNDLVLGNPDEYKTKAPNAISVGKAVVSVSPMSVLSDKIVIKSVEVRSPEITFEGNPFGANNLKKIMDNVNAFVGGISGAPDTNAPAKTGAAKPAKKLEVDDFLITGAKVHFNGATLPLPDIHFTDLGKGPDGITAGDLIKKVMGEITTATVKAVIASAADAGKAIGGAVGDTGKALGGEAGKLGKSIGGLFKK